MIPEAAVEAALNAMGARGPVTRWVVRTVLESAAPHMMAQAWAEGHESGFWNGRESTGHHEMRYVGLEHAQLNNPYRAATERGPV